MALELAQVIAELVEAVGLFGQVEGGEDGLVDLPGAPAAEVVAAVEEDLQQADHPRVVDFDSRIADGADSDGQGDALEQGEVDVNVKPLGLEAGKAVGDGPEGLAYCVEVVEVFAQAEVGQVVGAQFIAQEGGEFLVLF